MKNQYIGEWIDKKGVGDSWTALRELPSREIAPRIIALRPIAPWMIALQTISLRIIAPKDNFLREKLPHQIITPKDNCPQGKLPPFI